MLHFISWKMYGISLIVGLAFFYGYVGYKNFTLIIRFAGRLWSLASKGEQGAKKKGPGPEKEVPGAKDKETEEQGQDVQEAKKKAPGSGGAGGNGNAVTGLVLLALVLPVAAWAQTTADGATGINQANTMIRSYFDPAVNLMYAAGALAGLVGGHKVYKSMNNKEHDADNRAAVWFGGCIFLVLVATVLKAFFGL